ncbi:hypothetical protein E1A91_D11G147300v1, partial [Gossypium mustelinum]
SFTLCKQTMSLPHKPPGELKSNFFRPRLEKEKVVIIMGATGTGKSRLSIDLATRFPAEIINSDGTRHNDQEDPEEERCGVPHHLLGEISPYTDFTITDFVDMASHAMDSVLSGGRVPIIAGGWNSYIEALVDDEDFYAYQNSERVDKMVEMGMVDEVRTFFDANANYAVGIRKAIGVPEFDRYFRAEPYLDKQQRGKLLQEAIQEIKRNTCKLACRQLEKIHRLRNKKNWKIHMVDATEVFGRRGKDADEAWEKLVAGHSTEIVAEFLYNFSSQKSDPGH